MKDINDLMSQFDDLQDLPVSEELIGAYLEHTLTGSDLELVETAIQQDDSMKNLFAVTNSTDMDILSADWSVYDGDYGFLELGIPPVLYGFNDFSSENQFQTFNEPLLDEISTSQVDKVNDVNASPVEDDSNDQISDAGNLDVSDDVADLF